jgi:hypothetical protein
VSASDKPGPVFNLDTLEREGEAPEPFSFVANGERYTVADLESGDWRLLASGDPAQTLQGALGDEQYAKFTKKATPMWKVNRLADAITAHFGLGEPGEGNASSGS